MVLDKNVIGIAAALKLCSVADFNIFVLIIDYGVYGKSAPSCVVAVAAFHRMSTPTFHTLYYTTNLLR